VIARDILGSVLYYLTAVAGCVLLAGALHELASEQRRQIGGVQ
jgi:hypothetical protein